MKRIKTGTYRHYKGQLYQVLGEYVFSETLEEVEIDGQKVPRFKYLGN